MQNRNVEAAVYNSKKLKDAVHEVGLKIKHHEDNIKFLKAQKNGLDNSISYMQDVTFPKSSGRSNLPQNYFEIERQLKEMKWKNERTVEDMQREQALLDHARFNFDIKKQEYLEFLSLSSSYATQSWTFLTRSSLSMKDPAFYLIGMELQVGGERLTSTAKSESLLDIGQKALSVAKPALIQSETLPSRISGIVL
ncbi:hypothetical protein HAX54_025911 [Datura stramonium]|uniref:Uncharacterized protein n=1 Tax=Datura stramonium TaxID=4076 RepID=A0ABS8S6K0_DATST|nr:hypothetical protein [Datura stramonium]